MRSSSGGQDAQVLLDPSTTRCGYGHLDDARMPSLQRMASWDFLILILPMANLYKILSLHRGHNFEFRKRRAQANHPTERSIDGHWSDWLYIDELQDIHTERLTT
jgi:hypothetical protein